MTNNDNYTKSIYPASPVNWILNPEECPLSVRAYNFCFRENLTNIEDLLSFYAKNREFAGLKNIGKKTQYELISFCKNFIDNNLEKDSADNSFSGFNFDKLSPLQRSEVNNYILSKMNMLSIRARKALYFACSNRINIKNLLVYFKNRDNINYISNVGEKASVEISAYLTSIESFAEEIANINDTNIENRFFIQFFSINFKLPENYWLQYQDRIYQRAFPLLSFINDLIDSNRFLEEKKALIFKNRFNLYLNPSKLRLEKIGEILSLTRERVRQLEALIPNAVEEKFLFFEKNKTLIRAFVNYEIDVKKNIILINHLNINTQEKVAFSNQFITKVFSYIYSDWFIYFGEKLSNLKFNYLIQKKIALIFHFEDCIKSIQLQLEEKMDENCVFNLEEYISPFFISNKDKFIKEIKQVIKFIIEKEAKNLINFKGVEQIIFVKNTNQKLVKIVYNVLSQHGKPMTLTEISEAIKAQSGQKYIVTTLRSMVVKNKDIFFQFNKTSIFSLNEWNNEYENIKGGSIKDLAEEFLQQFDEPKHISEISSHILNFRPESNLRSIENNLRFDINNRFTVFDAFFFGIASKKYSAELSFNPIPRWLGGKISKFLKEFPNTEYDAVVDFFCKKYDLQTVQMTHCLNNAIKNGTLYQENYSNKLYAKKRKRKTNI